MYVVTLSVFHNLAIWLLYVNKPEPMNLCMEQLTCQPARQGSQLHCSQKTTENIHVSDRLRRIVNFFYYCAL